MREKTFRLCLSFVLIALMSLNGCFLPAFLVYADEKTPVIKLATPDEESIMVQRIVYTMLKRAGYQVVSKPSGMRTAVEELLKGDADMLPAQVAWLGEQNPDLVRIPVSSTTVSFDVYARDNSVWAIHSWDDLSGFRVATRWQNLYIEEHLPEQAMNIKVSEFSELWDALVSGDADVCILANPEGAERVAPKGLKKAGTIETPPVYPYVDQKYAEEVPVFVKTLQEMKRDGTIDAIKANRLADRDEVVLHISSYSSDMLWEREMIDGVREGLELDENGRGILYYNFNLNARRARNVSNQQVSLARVIRDAFMERTPDVVIVSDNDALEFVKENYSNLFLNTPVVFCGINNFKPEMIYGFSNYAAGCTEVLSASATVQQMLALYPATKNIYIINDYTIAGEKSRQEIESQINKISTGVNIIFNDDVPFEQMLGDIESFGSDTLLLLGAYFRDADNRYLSEADVQKALYKVSKMPVFTLLSTGIGEGGFGGFVSSAKKQGLAGGSMAKQILGGKPVSRMPIVYAGESMNEWIFDAGIAQTFSISKKGLPEGSTFINHKESIWKGNETQAILASLVFLLLITVIANLLLQIRKKNKEEKARNLLRTKEESSGSTEAGEWEQKESASEQIENIIQGIPVGFAIVADGIFAKVNRYCQKELGLEIGDSVKNLYQNPATHEKIMREIQRQEFIGGEVIRLNMAGRETHRHYMNFGRVAFQGKQGYLIFAIDVEELERQKDYSRRSQDDLQKIIDALPSAMAIVAISTCELEYANNEFLQVYGYMTMEEAKNFDFRSIVEHVFARWRGSTVMFEYDSPFAREHDIHLKMFADQIVFRNKNCIVLIGQDISAETKNAEMLMHAAEKEKEANMLKGVFLANMSHEIRTPMNAIIGLAQLALMREQSDENSDLFSKISVSAKNLLSIINDILDFSKIEAEKMDFIIEEFNLEETITNTFLVAAERIEDKKVEILLDMDEEVPVHLCGDKIRLWQILKNLLDNAVKYTLQGRVVLKIEMESQTDDQIVLAFQVSDTGMGMTQEQLERLFAPFEQFHRNNTKKAGTGLGLSIAKQLIDLMGGDIQVESVQDKGTEFYIRIPFAKAENAVAVGEAARRSVGDSAQRVGTVLLADQDEYARRVMANILENAGIKTVFAGDGAEVMQIIREYENREEPIKTVILDDFSEEADGVEMARRLGRNDEITKLLLVSAGAKKKILQEELQEVGMKDTIEKPFIISTFLQKVCGVIPEKIQMAKERRPDFTGAKILLCEDNEINQEVAKGILESFHIATVVAENGQEALDRLEKEKFDLVLMDISMPVMDGHEATVRIRKSGAPYRDVPIVAMTANVMQDEIDKCFAEGMNEHIEKPIDLVKFQKMLSRFLASR